MNVKTTDLLFITVILMTTLRQITAIFETSANAFSLQFKQLSTELRIHIYESNF